MTKVVTLAGLALDIYDDSGSCSVDALRVDVPTTVSFTKGFLAGAYVLKGGVGVVAYRGSATVEDWVYADFSDIAWDRLPTSNLGDAFSFFTSARKVLQGYHCGKVIVVGHSLGGGLAALVGANISSFPVAAVTFNAPNMAKVKVAGTYHDVASDSTFLRAVSDVGRYHSSNPLAAIGAFEVAIFSGAVKVVRDRAETALAASGSARLNLPLSNKAHVTNIRSQGDPVSAINSGDYIGRSPNYVQGIPITNYDCHKMGPLYEKLKTIPLGSLEI